MKRFGQPTGFTDIHSLHVTPNGSDALARLCSAQRSETRALVGSVCVQSKMLEIHNLSQPPLCLCRCAERGCRWRFRKCWPSARRCRTMRTWRTGCRPRNPPRGPPRQPRRRPSQPVAPLLPAGRGARAATAAMEQNPTLALIHCATPQKAAPARSMAPKLRFCVVGMEGSGSRPQRIGMKFMGGNRAAAISRAVQQERSLHRRSVHGCLWRWRCGFLCQAMRHVYHKCHGVLMGVRCLFMTQSRQSSAW